MMQRQPLSEDTKAAIQLFKAFADAIGLKPDTKPNPRQKMLMGFSTATKRLIIKCIELDPALEEAILKLAECAYADGQDSVD